MTRRTIATLAAAASALVLSGCTTFTDSGLAARAGDLEMTDEQLGDITREAMGDAEADRAPADVTNNVLFLFMLNGVIRADLDTLGVDIADATDGPDFATLQRETDEAFALWQETPPGEIDTDAFAEVYRRGPEISGIACTRHILVETESEADAVLDELAEGADFAELAADRSIDPGSAELGGVLPCTDIGTFTTQYIPEYTEAALTADIGEPVGPVESQFGYHVIEVREAANIEVAEIEQLATAPQVRFDLAAVSVDTYVDGRYGSFEGARGVVPLG